MKLLYVTSTLPYGTSEAFLIPEVQELRRRGHEVVVVPMRPGARVVHGDAAEVVRCAVAEGVLSPRVLAGAAAEALASPRRAASAVRVLLRSRSPRVLAKNLAVLPKGLWSARLARRLGADHIHAHWASSSGTIGLVASLVSGVPWSLTAHRWDIEEDNLLAEKARSAEFLRVISDRGLREASELAGPHAAKVVKIYMGVRLPPPSPPRPPLGRADGDGRPATRLVVAANLLEVKGHVYLIDAVRLLRDRGFDVALDVAGGGPLRPALEARVARHALGDRVRFLGVLPHDALLDGLRAGRWTAMVLPSIVTPSGVQEGIPVSLIEAMACGVPVVSTRTGGIPELLEDGAGLLVRHGSGEELAGAIEALATDPELRLRVARAGARRVKDSFAIQTSVSALLERMGAADAEAARGDDGGGVRRRGGAAT